MKKMIFRFHGAKDEGGHEREAAGKNQGFKLVRKEVLVKKGIQLIKDDDQYELEDEKYFRAIRCFDAALKQDRKDETALYHRAYCLAKLRKYDQAAIELEKFLEICPDNQDAALVMMHVCSKLNRECGEKMNAFLSRLNKHQEHAAKLVKIYDKIGKMFSKIGDEQMANGCFAKARQLKQGRKKNPG